MLRCVVAWDRADCKWFMKQTGLKHVLKSFKRLMFSPSFQTTHMCVYCMTSFAILVSPRTIVGTGSARGGPYRNSPRRAHSGTFTISPTTGKKPPPPYNVRGPVLFQKVTFSKPSLFPWPQPRPTWPTKWKNVGHAGLGCGTGNSNNSETRKCWYSFKPSFPI